MLDGFGFASLNDIAAILLNVYSVTDCLIGDYSEDGPASKLHARKRTQLSLTPSSTCSKKALSLSNFNIVGTCSTAQGALLFNARSRAF